MIEPFFVENLIHIGNNLFKSVTKRVGYPVSLSIIQKTAKSTFGNTVT